MRETRPAGTTAWLGDLIAGTAEPDELVRRPGQRWTEETIREALEKARTRPGVPLALSVHPTHGSAAVVRLRKMRDPRWRGDEFKFRTKTLGEPDEAGRMSAVVVIAPRTRSKR